MKIRAIEPERDAEAIAALIRDASPVAVITPASWLHAERTAPERARLRTWVAEAGGAPVGRSFVRLSIFGGSAATLNVAVLRSHRRQGIGSALYEVALEYARSLAPPEIISDFYETPDGVRFAEAREFRQSRAEQLSVLDPRGVSERPTAEVRPLTEADPRDAHRIDETTSRDMPAHEPIAEIPYDEWEGWVLAEPLFQRAGSFVAYHEGAPAALSLLMADLEHGRAFNMYTGTLREFRGHGLGTAAKLASIHWAAEHGVAHMVTTNDETNAPMLAINRRLGYEPAGRRVEYVREPAGTASSPAPPEPAT